MSTDSDVPDGSVTWAELIRAKRWTDAEGTVWRMRGGPMRPSAVRRLLKHDGIRVLHVYGPEPELLTGEALNTVLDRYWNFVAGKAQPFSDFQVGDFRDPERNVVVVFEESC